MTYRRLLLGVLALGVLIGAARADDKSSRIEDKLLGDLEQELLKGLDGANKDQASKGATSKKTAAGEDIGSAGENENPLAKIARKMRSSEQLIGKTDTSKTTQKIQKEIVGELDTLIAALKKQCAQCKGGGSPKPGGKKNPSAGNSAASKAGNKPARESTDRVGKSKEKEVDGAEANRLVKAVWGHLPKRIVERISKSGDYKFLPKYEQLIEDYFRRLAEDEDL